MRVLVTGGAGYVGSNLVDALLDGGHQVWVVDDLSTGRLDNIRHRLEDPGFHFIHDTILNRTLLEQVIPQVALVYHLAAVVGVRHVVEDPGRCIRVNVQGTEAVLDQALRNRVRTVIVSSSEVYGKSEALPLSEDDDCLLGPTTSPRWSYALSKAVDEHLALDCARQGLPVTVVRYFNSYGPRLDARGYGSVVARFISQALAGQPLTVYDDGRQTRCFTYVDDTVRGTILAGTLPQSCGQVFNIGSDRDIQILDLARRVRDAVGSQSEISHISSRQVYGARFEESRLRRPDVRKAARLLGFRAEMPLEQGLRRTVEWFRNRDATLGLDPAGAPLWA